MERVIDRASDQHDPTKGELSSIAADYDGAVAYMDLHVGELVERLERSGQMENTILIVTADHGEGLGEKYVFGHGVSADQNQLGVPFLVKYPHQKEHEEVSVPVSQVDVLPTVWMFWNFRRRP